MRCRCLASRTKSQAASAKHATSFYLAALTHVASTEGQTLSVNARPTQRCQPSFKSSARVTETCCPSLDLLLKGSHILIALQALLEILQLLALLLLDLQGNLATARKELCDFLELFRAAASCCHGWCTNADTSRGKRRGITVHGIPVQGNRRGLADLLHFRTREAVWAQVPENEVVVGAIACQLVALRLQSFGKDICVSNYLLRVLHKFWGVDLQQLCCEATNLVIVRATLQSREHCHVDALLDIRDLIGVLEENHACTRSSQGLVGRGGHDIAVGEWRWVLLCGHQSGDVGNVGHEVCANFVSNLLEFGKVDHTRVCRCTTNNHRRAEEQG